jgi:hypothetical protein
LPDRVISIKGFFDYKSKETTTSLGKLHFLLIDIKPRVAPKAYKWVQGVMVFSSGSILTFLTAPINVFGETGVQQILDMDNYEVKSILCCLSYSFNI